MQGYVLRFRTDDPRRPWSHAWAV